MINATLFPGKYIQGRDAIAGLQEWVRRYGRKAFVIGSPSTFTAITLDLRRPCRNRWRLSPSPSSGNVRMKKSRG